MRRVNAYEFYRLASVLKPLKRQYTESLKFEVIFSDLIAAQAAFDVFMTAWRDHLSTSRAAANALGEAITSIFTQVVKSGSEQWAEIADKEIPWLDLKSLADAIIRFESVLAEEAAIGNTYLVDEKGVYSIARLVDDAAVALPIAVRTAMAEGALNDFREAGRCLALDRFTATGFHVLRSLEAVVVAYLTKLAKKAVGTGARSWGTYVQALKDAGAPPELSGLLTQIKDLHRNPLMHPEDFLDEDEAIGLFDIAKSAIAAFVRATIKLTVPAAP